MRTIRAALLAGILVGTSVLSSCTTAATTTTTSTTTVENAARFGFVRGLDDGTLSFDPADFLTGEDALIAARTDGAIEPNEDLPNDFYIRNADATEARRLQVADGAEFVLIGLDSSGALADQPVGYDELAGLFAGSTDSSGLYGFIPGDLPMVLSLSGDTVTGGSQQYLP